MRLRLTILIRHGCLEGVVEQVVEDPIESAGKDWLVGGGRRRKKIDLLQVIIGGKGEVMEWQDRGDAWAAWQEGEVGPMLSPWSSSCYPREACWWTCSVTRC